MEEKKIKCPICGAVFVESEFDLINLEVDPTNSDYNTCECTCIECGCDFTVKATVEYQVIE